MKAVARANMAGAHSIGQNDGGVAGDSVVGIAGGSFEGHCAVVVGNNAEVMRAILCAACC